MNKNMKKHFTALGLTAVFLTTIPLITLNLSASKTQSTKSTAKKNIELTDMLAYEFKEDYCDDGLKALGIILNSNYKSGTSPKTISKKDFLKEHKNGKKYYSLLEKISKKIKDRCITYKGKAARIPYYYITNGSCKSEKPYLRNTVSPSDLLCEEYTFDAKPGVSLYSINKMCERGLSCEESLNRYFKNIEITAVND